MNLRTPLCETLGIQYPIFLAGMGGVAYADVCAAVSEAGGMGTLGMAAEGPEKIRAEMRRVREQTDKPFGVDLLAALPDSMMRAIDVIIEEGARVFVAGLGVPGPSSRSVTTRGSRSGACAARSATPSPPSRPAATWWWRRAPRRAATPARSPAWR